MALLPFVKVEGLGNDFLVVDVRPGKPAHAMADVATRPDIVRALCDRNFGVGGDGVLAILPGETGDARMRVLNADENARSAIALIDQAQQLYRRRDKLTDLSLARAEIEEFAAGLPQRIQLDLVFEGDRELTLMRQGKYAIKLGE